MAAEDVKIIKIVQKAKNGDNKSFNQLLKMVEPDLKKIASHFFILGGDREDVLQELRLGVVKAVNSYDPTKDTTFKNFCVNLVCKRHLATAISSAKRMKNSILNDSVSLDAPIILGDDGNLQTLADFIPDRLNPFDESPETNLVEDIIIKEEYEQASTLLKEKLTDLEEDIFIEMTDNSAHIKNRQFGFEISSKKEFMPAATLYVTREMKNGLYSPFGTNRSLDLNFYCTPEI
jgi:RNA polymerase sporulation-specific sigma factor